jgi:hypothetical protein
MSFIMVGETQDSFSNYGISCSSILGIVCSQIEIEFFFSLAEILTNLRRCHLQSNNLNKIIFVSKNRPSGHRVGCSSPSIK